VHISSLSYFTSPSCSPHDHAGSSRGKRTSPAMSGYEALDHIFGVFLDHTTWKNQTPQAPWLASGSFACLDARRLINLTRSPVRLSLICLLLLMSRVRSVKTRPAQRYHLALHRQLQGQSPHPSTNLCISAQLQLFLDPPLVIRQYHYLWCRELQRRLAFPSIDLCSSAQPQLFLNLPLVTRWYHHFPRRELQRLLAPPSIDLCSSDLLRRLLSPLRHHTRSMLCFPLP